MTPTTACLVPGDRGKQSADGTTDLNQLNSLGAKIRCHHDYVLAHQSQALGEARNCGEFVAKARPIWSKQRACGQCKLTWEEWLLENAGVSRNTANNYLRIYVQFDKLEGLPPEQQTIAAAIEYLRSSTGATATHRTSRPSTVIVKAADLVATATRHDIQNVIDLTKLVAVLNDVLKVAHIAKIIKIKDLLE